MFSRLHTFIGGTHIDAAKNLTGYPRTRESRAAALDAYRSSCQTIGTAWRKGISWTKDRRSPGSSQQQYPCQCQRHGRWQRKTLSSQRHRRGLYGHQK